MGIRDEVQLRDPLFAPYIIKGDLMVQFQELGSHLDGTLYCKGPYIVKGTQELKVC